MALHETSLRRLALAKEIYMQSGIHVLKNASVDNISAILSLDQCVEMLVQSSLADKNKKYKGFRPELIKQFETIFSSTNLVAEITALHELRNNVQHSAIIPSHDEVVRFYNSVKIFFSEVCEKIYENEITFDSISLSFLIIGHPTNFIIKEMERAYGEGRYVDAKYYAQKAVMTHIELIEANMGIVGFYERKRFLATSFPPTTTSSSVYPEEDFLEDIVEAINDQDSFNSDTEHYLDELHDYLKNLESSFSAMSHRITLETFLDDAQKLFGLSFHRFRTKHEYGVPPSPNLSGFSIIRSTEKISKDQVDQARSLAYKIILGTQYKITTRKILRQFYVYDSYLVKNNDGYDYCLGCTFFAAEGTDYYLHIKNKDKKIVKTEEILTNDGLLTLIYVILIRVLCCRNSWRVRKPSLCC